MVLFRLDETTHTYFTVTYIRIRMYGNGNAINTGHNEVISFDLLWNKNAYIYILYVYVCIDIS